jgi:hypothetical protein
LVDKDSSCPLTVVISSEMEPGSRPIRTQLYSLCLRDNEVEVLLQVLGDRQDAPVEYPKLLLTRTKFIKPVSHACSEFDPAAYSQRLLQVTVSLQRIGLRRLSKFRKRSTINQWSDIFNVDFHLELIPHNLQNSPCRPA